MREGSLSRVALLNKEGYDTNMYGETHQSGILNHMDSLVGFGMVGAGLLFMLAVVCWILNDIARRK